MLLPDHDTVVAADDDDGDNGDGGNSGEADDSQYLVSLILVYRSSPVFPYCPAHYFPLLLLLFLFLLLFQHFLVFQPNNNVQQLITHLSPPSRTHCHLFIFIKKLSVLLDFLTFRFFCLEHDKF